MFILKAIWFLLPAGMANVVPVVARKFLPRWNLPIDLRRKWRGVEIFGAHKTYRGLTFGLLAGLMVYALQKNLFEKYDFVKNLSSFNYADISILFGAWMAFCSLLFDMIKSFFKRRLKIEPGRSWVPFDQVDWIVGLLVGSLVVFRPDLVLVVTSLFTGIALHFLMNGIGYLLRFNSKPL